MALLDLLAGRFVQGSTSDFILYLQRILDSRILPVESTDEAQLVDRITRKLVKDEPTAASALKFAALYRRLTELGLPKNRWAALYFLLAVSEQKNVAKFSFGNKAFVRPQIASADSNEAKSVIPVSLKSSASSRPTAATSMQSSVIHVIGFDEYKRIFCQTDQPSERSLFRDMLFVLQGIDGRVMSYDSKLDSYVINTKVPLSPPLQSLMRGLSELGWHYHRATELLQNRSSANAGLVSQSMCMAIQEELLEYHRLLVVLESQLDLETTNEQIGGLTLKRLLMWVQQPLEKLKVINIILECCQDLKGGALISGVFEYARHGDPIVSSLVDRLLQQICVPYFTMLRRWVIEGQLVNTTEDEFFVEQNVTKDHDVWTGRYTLRKDMIPSFFSQQLSNHILLIGKSLNFIRDVCEDKQWSLTNELATDENTTLPEDSKWLTYSDLSALTVVIGHLNTAASTHLLKLLKQKHSLLVHFDALKRYLLMGQGDLMQHLMDLLWDELNKPASNLHVHQLMSLLQTAIRVSNAQYDDPDVQQRLCIRKPEIFSGDCGWDVFTLDYQVNGPLLSILTPSEILSYSRLFKFLWHIRRVQHAVDNAWTAQMSLNVIAEVRSELHMAHLLRSEMKHFLTELQYYVLFEVLECSWKDLQKEISSATDMDQIIGAHHRYLVMLTSKALLDVPSKALQLRLRTITKTILDFQKVLLSLVKLVEVENRRRDDLRAQIDKRSAKGGWGVTGKSDVFVLPEEIQRTTLVDIRAKLQTIGADYRANFCLFLVEISSTSDFTLRSLGTRLDFNEYYATQQKKLMQSSSSSSSSSVLKTGSILS